MADAPLKTCTKCGVVHPATPEFWYRHKRVSDGLDERCKACSAEAGRKWYNANRERVLERVRQYREANPERVAERCRLHYQANREKKLAYQRQYKDANRERVLEQCRQYYAANREKWSEYYRQYREENPEKLAAYSRNRKAREKGNGSFHTAEDIQAQYARQKGKCFYCHKKVGEDYHVDHVVPLIKGGSNGPENLVVACPACNLSKHAKHPMDYCGRLL